MRAPWVDPDAVPAGYVAIVGAPIDTYATTVGQTGMRFGPRRIREASLFEAGYYGIQSDIGLTNFETGRILGWPETLKLVDTGDVAIIPNDTPKQVEVAAAHIADVTRTSGLTVTLGGDHFVAYPASLGAVRGLRERIPDLRLAYLHIDSHTDFVDFHHQSGSYHHGSAARRISEIGEISKMGWFGVNATTQLGQVETMYRNDYRVATAKYILDTGPARSMERLLDYLLEGANALYVSIDIDVVNASDAPATSAAIFRGLPGLAFLEALKVVAGVDMLAAVDLCEVNPEVDDSGRTEMLAAEALSTFIEPRVLEHVGDVPPEIFERILLK